MNLHRVTLIGLIAALGVSAGCIGEVEGNSLSYRNVVPDTDVDIGVEWDHGKLGFNQTFAFQTFPPEFGASTIGFCINDGTPNVRTGTIRARRTGTDEVVERTFTHTCGDVHHFEVTVDAAGNLVIEEL